MFLTFDHEPVKAGKVTFVVKNVSKDMVHEFIVGRSNYHLDDLPMSPDGTRIDEEKALTESHEVEDLDPGETRKLVVHLEPGHYIALCNLPGHAMAGMADEFEVVPATVHTSKASTGSTVR